MDHDHAAFSLDLASYTGPTQKQVYWAFTIQKVQLSVPIKEVFQTYLKEATKNCRHTNVLFL